MVEEKALSEKAEAKQGSGRDSGEPGGTKGPAERTASGKGSFRQELGGLCVL